MKLLLGPILTIGECRTEVWKFHVNLLFGDVEGDEPPKLSLDFGSEAGIRIGGPERTATFCDGAYACWSWPVSVDRAQKERWLHYALVPESGTAIRGLPTRSDFKGVAIPALGELPRCAFFSCNGLSDPKDKRRVGDLNAVWQRMVRRHFDAQDAMPADGHGGYHLLIGAGDQLYADEVWFRVPELAALDDVPLDDHGRRRDSSEGRRTIHDPPSDGFPRAIEEAYVDLYRRRWSQAEVAFMLARVPGIFTWDDHDIFDGWGSHAAKDLDSPYFRAVYEAAEKAFVAFQLGGGRHVVPQEGSGRRHFLQHLHFATGDRELDLVLLDLRSARRPDEVLGRAQWADLKRLLARINATPAPMGGRHVLVVSSVPVLYLGFGGVERALEKLPLRTYLEDDLRDQWESPAHRGERAALVMNLLECAEKDRVRVTLLSGDVHVAARGRITATRKGAAIEQLISSPIAHPPVPWPAWALMSMVAERGPFEIAEGVQGELQPISSKGLFLRERNWLSIRFDEAGHNEGRLWAKWFAEESGGISQEAVLPAL